MKRLPKVKLLMTHRIFLCRLRHVFPPCSKKPHGWLNPTSFFANFLILTSQSSRRVIYWSSRNLVSVPSLKYIACMYTFIFLLFLWSNWIQMKVIGSAFSIISHYLGKINRRVKNWDFSSNFSLNFLCNFLQKIFVNQKSYADIIYFSKAVKKDFFFTIIHV